MTRSDLVIAPQVIATHETNRKGNLIDLHQRSIDLASVIDILPGPRGQRLATIFQRSHWLHELDANFNSVWSVEVIPAVEFPIGDPSSAMISEIVEANKLSRSSTTDMVQVDGDVFMAATVPRAVVHALNQVHKIGLPVPELPTCNDLLLVRARRQAGETQLSYWIMPTPQCELGPRITAVDGHIAVVTGFHTPLATPRPNDTVQFDLGLAFFDTKAEQWTSTQTIALSPEDDWAESFAPCGQGWVCLAGETGVRGVNTGSQVTYGRGFVLSASLDGQLGEPIFFESERHTVIDHIAPGPDGSLFFFMRSNAPITHTADFDPSLNFNEGYLGLIESIPVPGQ